MKKIPVFITAVLSILALTCNSNGSNQETNYDSLVAQIETNNNNSNIVGEGNNEVKTKEKIYDELIIKGKDIWVRDVPSTGKVVMKLNDGEKCRILQKSELSFVNGLPDYWYQIEINANRGWVFGSQSNICLFNPVKEAFLGNLVSCDDEIISLSETPASFSYTFKADQSFVFNVAAGYIIEGKYNWSENQLTLKPKTLMISTPDGNESRSLTGNINFLVYRKDKIICMIEKENKLKEKEYAPKGGCYCIE
jgi:hypothetical protein